MLGSSTLSLFIGAVGQVGISLLGLMIGIKSLQKKQYRTSKAEADIRLFNLKDHVVNSSEAIQQLDDRLARMLFKLKCSH